MEYQQEQSHSLALNPMNAALEHDTKPEQKEGRPVFLRLKKMALHSERAGLVQQLLPIREHSISKALPEVKYERSPLRI